MAGFIRSKKSERTMTSKTIGTNVLLGVTGGIAAYKAAQLASSLTREGFMVRVVMTRGAESFVAPLTFASLTGNPVAGNMFDPAQEVTIGHIELARWADLVVVAPATANFLAKAAMGMADDLLGTVLLAADCPLLLAPAMNPQMYAHPAVKNNLETLVRRGTFLAGPASGRTACGEKGLGRMAEPEEIAELVKKSLAPDDLAGLKIVVTAGPTREHMDPVRYISNPSTGRMGLEVAHAAWLRGASVTLVMGPTALEPPYGVDVRRVTTAQEMYEATVDAAADAHAVIKAAAVSDFAPKDCVTYKVKKEDGAGQSCSFVSTPDILAALGKEKKDRILIGFAAETEDVIKNGRTKLERKNLDMLVANDISAPDSGFAVTTNQVHFITRNADPQALPLMSKSDVAWHILDKLTELRKGSF